MSGPRNIPAASPRLETLLPATSSPGRPRQRRQEAGLDRSHHRPGRSGHGREANVITIGASTTTTATQPNADAARIRLTATRTLALPKRAAGMLARGPTIVDGSIRTKPSAPTASAPPMIERDDQQRDQQDPVPGGPTGPGDLEATDVRIGDGRSDGPDSGPDRERERGRPSASSPVQVGCVGGGHQGSATTRRMLPADPGSVDSGHDAPTDLCEGGQLHRVGHPRDEPAGDARTARSAWPRASRTSPARPSSRTRPRRGASTPTSTSTRSPGARSRYATRSRPRPWTSSLAGARSIPRRRSPSRAARPRR